MFLTKIFLPLLTLSATACARPLHRRNVQRESDTILRDIEAINQAVNHVRESIGAYNGGDVTLTRSPIADSFLGIHSATETAVLHAEESEKISRSNSQRVARAIENGLGKTVPTIVEDLKAKGRMLKASGQQGVVVQELKGMREDVFGFLNVVKKYMSSDGAAMAEVMERIEASVENGIGWFSS